MTNKGCVCGLFVTVTGYLGSIQINSLPTDNQLVSFLWTNGWKIYQASIMENEFTGISQSKLLPPMYFFRTLSLSIFTLSRLCLRIKVSGSRLMSNTYDHIMFTSTWLFSTASYFIDQDHGHGYSISMQNWKYIYNRSVIYLVCWCCLFYGKAFRLNDSSDFWKKANL